MTRTRTVADAPLWRADLLASTSIEAVPDAIVAEGRGTWTCFHEDLTPALVGRAHGLGLRVIPWTVNGPEEMRGLIGWGLDGLITDWPDRALPLVPRPAAPVDAGGGSLTERAGRLFEAT